MKPKLFFLAGLFLFMQIVTITFAQITDVELDLGDRIVEPGEEFVLYLYVMSELPAPGDPNEVTSANIGITWDETMLEFRELEFGRAIPEGWTMSSVVGINTCDVEMSGTEPITLQAGILKYTFMTIGDAPNVTYVTFTEAIFNDGDPSTTTADGRITIEEPQSYILTVNIDPPEGGNVTKDPDQDEYNEGEEVTLTAIPNEGYRFVEWTGDITGTDSIITITMDSDKSVTAHFELVTFILTVNIDPPEGGSVNKDPDQSEYLQNEVVTLTAIPNEGYRFVEWTGDVTGTDSVVTLTMDSDKTVTAHFEIIDFTLTVYAYPPQGGSVIKDPNKSGYDHGEEVTLTAIPYEGYRFDEWNGDATGTDSIVTITMDSDKTITAQFEISPFTLTVNINPAEGGSVLKDPDKPGYDHGEEVNLTAIPKEGFRFVEWTGDVTGTDSVVTLTMDSDKTVTANFESITFVLTVNIEPPESGTVLKDPDKSVYDHGEQVTLTAIPKEGFQFVEWTGDVTGADSIATITMDSDKTVTAHFEPITFILTVHIDPSEGGAVLKNPDKPGYDHGEQVTLSAIPYTGYRFEEWTGDVSGIDSVITVTMSSDKTLTAHFIKTNEPDTVTLYIAKGWNMISINLDPSDPDIEKVMSPIVDKIKIVKDDSGRIYVYDQGVNTIGDINFKEGYQIYMSEADSLDVIGEMVDPMTPIMLPAQWSMISYLPNVPMDVDSALVSLNDPTIIIKDNEGQTYIPLYNINNIEKMQPGIGYQIYLNNIDTLIYPAGGRFLAATTVSDYKNDIISINQNLTEHFQFTSKTGENAIVVVTTDSELRYSDGTQLETGDEIGVFTSDGRCCGAIVWENVNVAITVWGDDSQTGSIDGFQTGDTLRYQIYRKRENKEYPAVATYQENHHLLYQPNGFSIITKLVANISTDVSDIDSRVTPSTFKLFQNYPNPFNPDTRINYQIPVSAHVKIKISNVLGQHIKTLVDEYKESGFHTVTWNRTDSFGNEVPSGVYFYSMSAHDYVMKKKMIIMK